MNIFIRNFVLCIQIHFVSTEKNYAHRLACILFQYAAVSLIALGSSFSKYHPPPIKENVLKLQDRYDDRYA